MLRTLPSLLVGSILAGSLPAAAAPREYAVDADASRVMVHVGKSGVFGFAGHEHEIRAGRVSGTITADDASIGGSSVMLDFDAAALTVTGEGEPAGDVAQVQTRMMGPDVLNAPAFPSIGFRSGAVTGRKVSTGAWELSVAGTLTLHGVSRPLSLSVRVEIAADTLTARGRSELRQTDFGMRPVSAGAGTVK